MAVKNLLGGPSKDEPVEHNSSKEDEYPWYKEHGMGTPLAEYGEDGPYHCCDCWYLKSRDPRSEPMGKCNEPHMLKDPKTKKELDGDGKAQFAIVNKEFGCCRFVDPVKVGERADRFVFANDLKEEAEEHGEEQEED